MINKFKQWYFKPAKWWHFWLPQSSIEGGLILGLVLAAILFIIMKVLGYE